MVETKLPGRGAGSVSRRVLLRGVAAGTVWALGGGLMSGCASAPRSIAASAGSPGSLTLIQSLQGARLMQNVGPGGIPSLQQGFGPLTLFVYPVAVAASPFALYIADAGVGRLYRYDPMVDAMAVVAGAVVTPQTRLALGPDGSIYVANQGGAPLRRYDREGRLLVELDPHWGASGYADIAVDEGSGMVYGLDYAMGRVEEIHPLGRSATLLAEGGMDGPPTALAWDSRRLYVAGVHCGCVVAMTPQSGATALVAQGLRRPAALAARDGWLVVLDSGDGKLGLFHHERLSAEVSMASLRLIDPQGIALSGGMLYVADAAGHRVVIFRMGK